MASAAGNMRDAAARPGRNEPCPCGSGRKYKQCCLASAARRPAGGRPTTGLPIPQVLRNAVELQRAGQLDEARLLYRQVLEARPEHAQALLLSGMLAYEQGRHDEAADSIRRSIRANPREPAAHCNLGNVLLALGEPQQAVESYGRALALNPAVAVAHFNLGNALKETGRIEEAVASYRRAIGIEPRYAEAHYNLGNALQELGLPDEAAASFRQAVSAAPQFAAALNNLGRMLQDRGEIEQAIDAYRRAIAAQPAFSEAHFNLGNALHERGRLDQAEASYRDAIALAPDHARAHNNLGNVLEEQGRFDEALASYRRAVEIEPGFAAAHNNLGNLLDDRGESQEAIGCYRRAIALAAGFADAWNNLGSALRKQGLLDDAAASYRRAVSIDPSFADAYNNLGHVLKAQHELDEAVASYRQAIVAAPDDAAGYAFLAGALRARGDLAEAVAINRRALLLKEPPVADEFSGALVLEQYSPDYSRERCLADHVAYAERFEAPLRTGWHAHERELDPERRLRVGLVSGDLGTHPVGYFLEGVLARLSRDAIDLVFYPTSDRSGDALTERLRGMGFEWNGLVDVDDAQAASGIEQDRIDILVDLSGHTSFNRLGVFARKPAPIEVTWLGYFATTGLQSMDYLLCDEHGVLPGEARYYTEQPWYLPHTRLCFTPPDEAIEVAALPALTNAALTFGCFNTLDKVNDAVARAWARLLDALPRARLFLKARELGQEAVRVRTRKRLAALGIQPDRLLLEGPSSRREYLAAYGRVDIALDPFPFTGATTTLEGLWMGVPAITLRGDRLLSRQGVGILSNLGMADWIAADEDEYVACAVARAGDLPGLAALRAGLRERLLASPLCAADAFARNLEAAFRGMWRRYCDRNARR